MRESHTGPWWARPLFLCAIAFAAVLMFFWRDLGAWDLWLHIRSGELILREHVVHKTDPYSFRALGRPWNNHQWLGSLLLYGIWSAAGAAGVVILRCLLIGTALVGSWALARRRGVDAGLATLLMLGAAFQLRVRALARPYLISFVMFVVVLWVLYDCILREEEPASNTTERAKRPFVREDRYLWGSGGRLLLLLPLMWLWANLHAGFLMGLLLLGTFGVGELIRVAAQRGEDGLWQAVWRRPVGARFRAMLVVGTACMALTVVTPYGAETVLYPFRLTLTVDLLSRIAEWRPVKFTRSYALYWCVLTLGTMIMLRSAASRAFRGKLRERAGVYATDLLLFAGFSFLPIRGVRHIAWVLFIMPAILGHHLVLDPDAPGSKPLRVRFFAAGALLVALLLGPVRSLSRGVPAPGLRAEWYPLAACEFMEEQGLVDLRMYNSYEWGGYLIWRWAPEHKVFIDGRCLVYRDDLLGETFTVSDGKQGWRDVLEGWGVGVILFRYQAYDASHLFRQGGWQCVYWDDTALVLLTQEEVGERNLPDLDASNPVLFDWAEGPDDLAEARREIDIVLGRDPACWTALAEKSRCLVAEAEREEEGEQLQKAGELVRRALDLSGRDHSAPWLAAYHLARVRGDDAAAAHARQRAYATRERWLSRKDIERRLGVEDQEDADEAATPEAPDDANASGP